MDIFRNRTYNTGKRNILIAIGIFILLSIPFFYLIEDTTESSHNLNNIIHIKKTEITNISIIFFDEPQDSIILNCTTMVNDTQNTVFDVMVEVLGGINNIDFYSTSFGVFINGMKINSSWYSQTSNRFWIYEVNNEISTISCSRYPIESNDSIIWYYTSNSPFNENNTPKDYTYEFILFIIIIISVIGGLVVLGVFLRNRK